MSVDDTQRAVRNSVSMVYSSKDDPTLHPLMLLKNSSGTSDIYDGR